MNIWFYMIHTGLLLFLGIAAQLDLRSKSLGLIFLCAGFTAGVVLQTLSGELSLWEIAGGAALGGAAVLISVLSKNGIGLADGFLLGICGVWLGFASAAVLMLISLLIMAAAAILMISLKKARFKDSLPFAPFLLAGYIVVLIFL